MDKKQLKKTWRKTWHFIWEEDSVWSWLVNILLAFILIKFLVYPALGFTLGTSYPVVAVVSSSMEHNSGFDEWWSDSSAWYMNRNISRKEFMEFSMANGFNKGDIIILRGTKPKDIKIGDIIVFRSARRSPKADPIIHRVVSIDEAEGRLVFQTKGDNPKTNTRQINGCFPDGCIFESDIWDEQIIGKAALRVPFLGYVKIGFVWLLSTLNIIR